MISVSLEGGISIDFINKNGKGCSLVPDKKVILTYHGLQELEQEIQELKVVKRKEIAEKIKEARAQGDLSENAEYDAAKERLMFLIDPSLPANIVFNHALA